MWLALLINTHQHANQKPIWSAPAYQVLVSCPDYFHTRRGKITMACSIFVLSTTLVELQSDCFFLFFLWVTFKLHAICYVVRRHEYSRRLCATEKGQVDRAIEAAQSWGMLDWYQNKRRLYGVSLAVKMNFSVCQLAVESPYALQRYHGFWMSYISKRETVSSY